MRFIGQHHIMNQLKFILPDLYQNPKKGANLLLVGPSGFGKTMMAVSIANYLAGNHFEYYLGDWTEFKFHRRVIFIDEIHTMNNYEFLYPLMDIKYGDESHIFILATNENGELPEPLINRCYEFIFDDYDDEELVLIARESSSFSASDEAYMKIVEAGSRNPRKIKSLVDRLGIYFSQKGVDSNLANYDEILVEVFRIENGLDTLCRRYIEVLEQIGGKASLTMLQNILHVNKNTLVNQVEPILARRGLLEISSRGRKLI